MKLEDFSFVEENIVPSPQLIFNKEAISYNFDVIVDLVGNVGRLWPHVKSHKAAKMVAFQQDRGVKRFKCATIAEAEMLAQCGVDHILLAYPVVGPNLTRFMDLIKTYPSPTYWTIADDIFMTNELSRLCVNAKVEVNLLVDIDSGEHRTGVPFERVKEFFFALADLPGIKLRGFHCYDGTRQLLSYEERESITFDVNRRLEELSASLSSSGFDCGTIVIGGTPSFPFHAKHATKTYLSPESCFLFDWGSFKKYDYLKMRFAAAVMSRVISTPKPEYFTLDLGYKGIAADPVGERGVLLGFKDAEPIFQNEEHWVWQWNNPKSLGKLKVGDIVYVVPTHVCPTSSLYKEVLLIDMHKFSDVWQITARDRRLSI